MPVDNRTEINDCEGPTTEFDGSDVGAVDSELFYEGSSSISAQFSNAQEFLIAHQNSAGTNLNLDLSDATVWLIVKDNLVASEALNGMQVVLGDGDANNDPNQGYVIGGNDNPGLVLGKQFYCLRLDVSNRAGLTVIQHRSNGAPTFTAIGSVGYGALHAIAARGNVDNLFLDRMTFHPNGSYAFTIDSGTSGTPITFDALQTQDDNPATGGWGLFGAGVGSSFTLFASMEWGTPTGTADSYFSQSDSQIYFDGQQLGAGNFIFRTIGNSTGTNSFVLNNCVFVSAGEPAIWDYTDVNMNILDIQDTQYIDMGTIAWPVTGGTTRQVLNSSFINCGQVDFSTITATGCSIIGGRNANGGILLDASGNSTNQTNLTFTSDGTGHGVEITAAGTYTFTNWNFSGYSTASPGTNSTPSSGSTDAMVFNNSGGAVTINIFGGTNVTVRNAASSTTTVVVAVTATVSGLLGNTEVSVLENPSPYTQTLAEQQAGAGPVSLFNEDFVSAVTGTDILVDTESGANVTRITSTTTDFTDMTGLVAGDFIRVTERVSGQNLRTFDTFEVVSVATNTIDVVDVASSTLVQQSIIDTTGDTITVEKIDASYTFVVSTGEVVDILLFRVGSLPIFLLNQTISSTNNSFPVSQSLDRNFEV